MRKILNVVTLGLLLSMNVQANDFTLLLQDLDNAISNARSAVNLHSDMEILSDDHIQTGIHSPKFYKNVVAANDVRSEYETDFINFREEINKIIKVTYLKANKSDLTDV